MKNIRPHHIISGLAIGGLFLATLNFNTQPLFTDLNQFVLVAEDSIRLAQDVQVSSGDVAANEEIAIASNNIINSNLFADKIKITGNTQVNGGISFNELQASPTSIILGTTSTPISLPIIELPDVPDFETGDRDLIVTEDETISPSNFSKLEVKEGITLTLTPGTYNLNELALRDSAKLLFIATTTINIKQTLKINANVLITPNVNIPPTALIFNIKSESKTAGKGKQESKGVQLVTIGEDSFISLKLVAPGSKVHLGDRVTFRGQIVAEEIKVGEGSILSREDVFSKESDSEKVVEDQEIKFIVNEIVVLFQDEATQADAQQVADLVNGRITGFIPDPPTYKIELITSTVEEIQNVIQTIKDSNNPLIVDVVQNLVSQ